MPDRPAGEAEGGADSRAGGPEVRAAGGVVWRESSGGEAEVLLIHRDRYDDWSFPKGKAEPDESDEDCARREVFEETGIRCSLGPELATVRYVDHKGRPKVVRYWAMVAAGGLDRFVANDEVDGIRWLRSLDVRSLLSYAHDRAVIDAFDAIGRRP